MAKTFTNPGLNGSRFVNQSKFNQSKSNFNKKWLLISILKIFLYKAKTNRINKNMNKMIK
jgi:hypothetical protein